VSPAADWPAGRECIERTPFKRGADTLIEKRRRIDESEEAALLAEAAPHIQAMIFAAIDTGMRQGEMLALRFGGVDFERGLLRLRGETLVFSNEAGEPLRLFHHIWVSLVPRAHGLTPIQNNQPLSMRVGYGGARSSSSREVV
jgi:integrase